MPVRLPAGYERIVVGRCSAVVRADFRDDARAMLAEGTLYEAAARDLAARSLAGRGVAYAIALPASGTRVVVRHNRHGGAFARLTRDLFLAPTRAPYELAVSLRLAELGVRTPEVLMYGVQHVTPLLRRADVVTREITGGRDLASYLMSSTPPHERDEAWRAARALVLSLNTAGARHHDLNVKNILLASSAGALAAWVLDVDRVDFGDRNSAAVRAGNAQRLLRSARKWRDLHGAVFDERELGPLLE
jgi:tRNA A-37 threonylcarbamoyl transferase component Bud32